MQLTLCLWATLRWFHSGIYKYDEEVALAATVSRFLPNGLASLSLGLPSHNKGLLKTIRKAQNVSCYLELLHYGPDPVFLIAYVSHREARMNRPSTCWCPGSALNLPATQHFASGSTSSAVPLSPFAARKRSGSLANSVALRRRR
jgi:hypothetical protein